MPAHRPPGEVCWGEASHVSERYQQPKGRVIVKASNIRPDLPRSVPRERYERPMWHNHSNPMQYDKSCLMRQDIARDKTMRESWKLTDARKNEMGATALGWNNGLTRPIEAGGRADPLARSLSQPILGRTSSFDRRTFDCIASPTANCTIKLSGDSVNAHLAGYRGNIRGWDTEAASTIGHRFGSATTSLNRLQSPKLQRTPAPFLADIGGAGTGNPFGPPDNFRRTR
eukprot:TRINITY_DN74301_c0_g1_i1.p1 TRINITY_DN74301_c0_g1~~TRINITY_DN74301_c0_g1_i1.p1  ORF type:complete len:228 (-),score=26.66 TRINITY_DN74301_c0_g1_i1:72-755(-)